MNLESLEVGKASITPSTDGGTVTLKIVGEIDMQDPSLEIGPYMEKIHNAFLDSGVKEVETDFQELKFMNSSGIKVFVNWIMKLNLAPEDKKYKIKILYKKDVTWQTSSLPVLQKLQPTLIEVVAR